jgi:hypothetical protein
MKQEWVVVRQTVPQVDGERRWDIAYQCLLRWTRAVSRPSVLIESRQEVCDESSDLRTSVDTEAGTGPNY